MAGGRRRDSKQLQDVTELLRPCIEGNWPVDLHPDAIGDHRRWRDFGRLLCVENMDKRKPDGRG
jgi:hypothetical protein